MAQQATITDYTDPTPARAIERIQRQARQALRKEGRA